MGRFTKIIAAAATLLLLSSTADAAATKGVVLVVGATGQTGHQVAEMLKARGYTVRSMVRDPARAGDLPSLGKIVVADLTKRDTLPAAVNGVDYVVCAVGSTASGEQPEAIEYNGVAALADAAKAAKVKQMVLLSAMAAADLDPNSPLNKNNGMLMIWKAKGENYLRTSGLHYTIVRPSGLDNCEGGKSGIAFFPRGIANGSRGRICRADVARVMTAATANPDALGKTIGLSNDTATAPDTWVANFAAMPKD